MSTLDQQKQQMKKDSQFSPRRGGGTAAGRDNLPAEGAAVDEAAHLLFM